ncbi:ABC transporter substrate-binding protein [Cohnella endophytica]|uniref:ABC transporter substrate-binding protein n=1 Tax=Cohnella endophytica TaxID=2419778 RepID=A0A494Y059_9BACL|nr:ABC transporter substrate-binding protein [Cohnella endophytica]RKP55388.1 ABC transporter substrate-binding protein [Cohnella endophytica]
MKKRNKTVKGLALTLLAGLLLAGCGNKEASNASGQSSQPASASASAGALQEVTLVLDWTPNTNHTGLYVARDMGLWEKHGLKVNLIQPPEAGASALVANNTAEFGVGAQESMILAREQGLPLVSIAPIIQHNTSGFASPVDRNIKEPKDFEGKSYGGWGSPAEQAVIESMMNVQKANVSKVNFVSAGTADFFTAVKKGIDFEWIFYGWTGIEAELRKEPVNMVYLTDYSKQLDYYTPLLLTNEKMIKDKPDIVRAFLAGASEGYNYAIEHPDEAAEVLIKAEPEINADLVKASQKWLSPKYKDDAPRWGEQKREVWSGYGDWLKQNGLMKKDLNYDDMFTTEFLPK